MRRPTSPTRRRRDGFTLIEVLLVMAILVILASFVIFNFTNIMGDADKKAARIQIAAFETGVNTYYLHVKQYPSALEDLQEAPSDLTDPTRWKGPYLQKEIPMDPWGRPYQYAAPEQAGSPPRISSLGPDGAEGTEDDVSNFDAP